MYCPIQGPQCFQRDDSRRKGEAREEGRRSVLEDLHVEREVFVRRKGIVRKRRLVVISERIVIGKLPITPFYEYERQFDEELDMKDLDVIANAARILTGLPDLTDVGLRVLSKAGTGRNLADGESRRASRRR